MREKRQEDKEMCVENKTKKALCEHWTEYKNLQLEDMYKFLYQSAFGCEHLLAEEEMVVAYIEKESKECRTHSGEMVEALDGEYCRVHLDYLKEGLSPRTLGKLFMLSARHEEEGWRLLEEKLEVLFELIRSGELPFDYNEATSLARKWKKEGYPACRHSQRFRECYGPAYRVLRKEYARFLPVFARIDSLIREKNVIIAVDGGSASGKTTFSKLLQDVYGCPVFHMDDFFLRPEQRTQARFAEPGGNVDRERFLEEVLEPLYKEEKIAYRRFDCTTGKVQKAVCIIPGRLNVVEGAYSLHPDLEKYYDLKVFLDVPPKLQHKRIEKRNTAKMAKRFFEEWIPMEKNYFERMKVAQRCDLIIETEES